MSWNRNHPLCRKSKQAVLSIVEGSNERRVRFDSGELTSGTVLYEPASSDVIFNLNVRDEGDGYVSESVRAIAVPTTSAPVSEAAPARKPPVAKAEADRGPIPGGVPGVIRRVLPSVPPRASATIRGTVRVDVRVEVVPSGAVSAAALNAPARSAYFADLALAAARKWKFAPGGPGTRVVRFEFTNDGPRAY